jgi:hypothetical protein
VRCWPRKRKYEELETEEPELKVALSANKKIARLGQVDGDLIRLL